MRSVTFLVAVLAASSPLGCDGPTDPAVRLEPSKFCSDHPDAAIPTFEEANLEREIRFELSVGEGDAQLG